MRAMKLIAGIAPLVLAAGSADAGTVFHGSITTPPGVSGPTVDVPLFGAINVGADTTLTDTSNASSAGYIQGAFPLINDINSSVAAFQIQGLAADNNGTAQSAAQPQFTLRGQVTPDCVYYTGSSSRDVNFGQIGIQATPNAGPARTLGMVAPATAVIQTNIAGCNTNNTVTIAKGHATGMQSSSVGAFDANQFTDNLPYTVEASWTGVPLGAASVGRQRGLTVADNVVQGSSTEGAWKSGFVMNVNVPVPSKALLAGQYTDTLTVTLAAQ